MAGLLPKCQSKSGKELFPTMWNGGGVGFFLALHQSFIFFFYHLKDGLNFLLAYSITHLFFCRHSLSMFHFSVFPEKFVSSFDTTTILISGDVNVYEIFHPISWALISLSSYLLMTLVLFKSLIPIYNLDFVIIGN